MANNKFDFIISPVSPCGQFLTAEEEAAVFINAPDLLGGVCSMNQAYAQFGLVFFNKKTACP